MPSLPGRLYDFCTVTLFKTCSPVLGGISPARLSAKRTTTAGSDFRIIAERSSRRRSQHSDTLKRCLQSPLCLGREGFELFAFLATFYVAGWRPGSSFPGGNLLLAASGAAFAAVVFGQIANAFACRSTRYSPARLGWTSNRLLMFAVMVEVLLLFLFFAVPQFAAILHHQWPSIAGAVSALTAIPAVFMVDFLYKRWARRKSSSRD